MTTEKMGFWKKTALINTTIVKTRLKWITEAVELGQTKEALEYTKMANNWLSIIEEDIKNIKEGSKPSE